jgi:basic membrane protein A
MADNVGVYDVRLEQGGYMMGLIAGYLTEAGIVGVIGGVDVSEIHRGHVAFMLGAEAAAEARELEEITVLNNFIGDFNDLAGAKEAALTQIGAGADVIWQSGDGIGLAILEACEEEDILCMGNVADQNEIAPENTLASFVYAWGPTYKQMIEETAEGTFGNKYYWNEFANEGVSIVPNEDLWDEYVDEDLQALLDEAQEGFVEGTLDLGDLDAVTLE